MMRLVAGLLAAALLGLAAPASADSFACGLKPMTPFGCASGYAVCTCDAQGNCKWVFICQPDS